MIPSPTPGILKKSNPHLQCIFCHPNQKLSDRPTVCFVHRVLIEEANSWPERNFAPITISSYEFILQRNGISICRAMLRPYLQTAHIPYCDSDGTHIGPNGEILEKS